MDINGLSSEAIAINMKQKTGDAVGTAVANKALDLQVESAAQIISSVEKPAATETNLGNKINT
ncbi:MAG TPA: putative motility protein, partial [Gammaproteobacteria bacterium]|nr:putative motility protein [Gammaproteobacteria bacterium]